MSDELKATAVNQQLDPSSPDYVSWAIPEEMRNNLAAYKADEGNEAVRNTLFQALYQKDKDLVGKRIGTEDFQGYNGMREAFNEAYGVQALADAAGGKAGAGNAEQVNSGNGNTVNAVPANNMPGANTDSTLAILQRR